MTVPTRFVDTNLFIRFLTNDDPAKGDRVAALLDQAASGAVRLMTSDLVLAEIAWVLESGYGLKRSEVAPLLRAILSTLGLSVTNAKTARRAVDLYEAHNVDYVDAVLGAEMEVRGVTKIYSFDKKQLSRLEGVERLEPYGRVLKSMKPELRSPENRWGVL